MDRMKLFLSDEGLSDIEVRTVITICENISYSKEKKGLLECLDYPISFLRNIVSDADKLDAIGYDGIERCRMYTQVNH